MSAYDWPIDLLTDAADIWTRFALQTPPWQMPADLAAWALAVTDRRPPQWTTAHTIDLVTPLARLRKFSPPGACGVPTLVVAPNAGHDSSVVDHAPGQSQMQTVLAAGLTRAYCVDWVGATSATRHAGITDYLAVLDQFVRHIAGPGGRVNLIGDCQGGWLAVLYAAMFPERANTLTVAGAPINTQVGDGQMRRLMPYLTPGDHMGFYQMLVASGGGMMPGRYMLSAFMGLQPGRNELAELGLLLDIRDPVKLERYRRFQDWYMHTQNLPGPFYLWAVENLFLHNRLFRGTLAVSGRRVDLRAITCPLFLLAGATDHITPAAQVQALAEVVGTPPARIQSLVAPGGHLGLFMGREALASYWTPILQAARALS